MNLPFGITLTILLLIGNGFFVAAEFALIAAKRARLERAAAEGNRAAASAVAGIRELSLMLAGAQLGITMCSLGLGLVSEPVIADTLIPPFHSAGLPTAAAHAVAFVIALSLVTFLHMVIGEMAPKSWAIAHPERSAILLAPPFRAFTRIVRPVLAFLNGISNVLLRLVGVRPRDQLSISRTPEQLGHLVEESRRLGLIEEADHNLLRRALQAPHAGLADLVIPAADIVSVPPDADPQTLIDTAARTQRTRILLREEAGTPTGLVHVRDAYLARAEGRCPSAAQLAHPVPALTVDTPVAGAVATLRSRHSQLGLVHDADGRLIGLISMDDLLATLLTAA
ncbi:hemolysin family protein [Actinomadura alba]|uniref:HlyC/CorC family transporter n=1 Tax=Actinomadura alba TaxID=406431 RepID=A0ABR7LWH8_9ACTN|nr:hemolysin family protein [Actinomadura alba]MBC6469119.1 HlyC/CorC family transporter [Actinomadura alba]